MCVHYQLNLIYLKVFDRDPDWILARCKRKIPLPEVLEERLTKVVEEFKRLDAKKDYPTAIISSDFESAFLNCLRHVRVGCLSDIPELPYYFLLGQDRNGLNLYHCKRGTSKVESVHQRLKEKLRHWNYGIDFIDIVLSVLRHRHNVRASQRHRLGFPNIGHYRFDLLDQIQCLAKKVGVNDKYIWWKSIKNFETSSERFGIIPVVAKAEQDYEEHKLDKSLSKTNVYICKCQNTLLPYLRVQSGLEKETYER